MIRNRSGENNDTQSNFLDDDANGRLKDRTRIRIQDIECADEDGEWQ